MFIWILNFIHLVLLVHRIHYLHVHITKLNHFLLKPIKGETLEVGVKVRGNEGVQIQHDEIHKANELDGDRAFPSRIRGIDLIVGNGMEGRMKL